MSSRKGMVAAFLMQSPPRGCFALHCPCLTSGPTYSGAARPVQRHDRTSRSAHYAGCDKGNSEAYVHADRRTIKFRLTCAVADETVFYNNNILHCASYSPNRPRATLHACMGDTHGGSARARNILQHGLEWMKEETFRETLDQKGKQMLERLVRMQEEFHGKGIEYSLEG